MTAHRRALAAATLILIGLTALILCAPDAEPPQTASPPEPPAPATTQRTRPPAEPDQAKPHDEWQASAMADVASLLGSNAWTQARCTLPENVPSPTHVSFPGPGLSSPALRSGSDTLFLVPPGEFDGLLHFSGTQASGEAVIFFDGQRWVCDAPMRSTQLSLESELDCIDDCPIHLRVREQILPVDACTTDWYETTILEPNIGWVDDETRPPTLVAWIGEGWRDLAAPVDCVVSDSAIECSTGDVSVASCEHLVPIKEYDATCDDDACKQGVVRAFHEFERLGEALGLPRSLAQAMSNDAATAEAVTQAFPELFFASVHVPYGDAATDVLSDARLPRDSIGWALVEYAASRDPATKP